MPNLAVERQHLVKANRDIAEGEKRILAQAQFIERLRRKGLETDQAERLLFNLQQTLAIWQAHREQIRQTITQLEQVAD
ncbi:MAG TPA: hypothetical protein VE690_12965 [Rhodopila sp.]|nr:hypothetical protein [Rhodopila sp.]